MRKPEEPSCILSDQLALVGFSVACLGELGVQSVSRVGPSAPGSRKRPSPHDVVQIEHVSNLEPDRVDTEVEHQVLLYVVAGWVGKVGLRPIAVPLVVVVSLL